MLKIPEEILKSGPLSLIFDTASTDVIDIKEYYIYDISCNWITDNGMSYEKTKEVTFKIKVDGIDTNSFVVYAIFEKDGKKVQQVIPDHIYSGEEAHDVKIYGSALDKDKLETFSGIKMLLDTQENCYQTTVAFDEIGKYQVHIYGESEKGFTQSDKLSFTITKSVDPETTWIDKLMALLHKVWEWFLKLPRWGQCIAVVSIVFIVFKVVPSIFSFLFYHKIKDEETDDDY